MYYEMDVKLLNMQYVPNTLNLETGSYFFIWTAAVLYSCFKVKTISEVLFVHHLSDTHSSSWNILSGRKKDESDNEWESITFTFYHQFIWISCHMIICEFLRWRNYYKLLPLAQIAITVLYLYFKFHISVLLIVFCQPILFEIVRRFKQNQIIWLCAIISLIVMHLYSDGFLNKYVPYLYEYTSYNDHVMIVHTLFWLNLRCISFALCKSDKNITQPDIVTTLSYCLYLPLFSNGPFISINDFCKGQYPVKVSFSKRIVICSLNLIRFMFWMFIMELLLHYIYASSISYFPKFVAKFDYWTLYGYGYCMGQLFHIKYVVLYGISTTLAKFDNIAAPNVPKCVGRIHLYSDMWRYFDSGLYTFLIRYIYIPLMKNRISQYLASFVTFCFIFVWHGLTMDVLIWGFLNYLCVTIETVFKHTYKLYFKKKCEELFSQAWRQRLGCSLAAPLFAISAISNFYFFAGVKVGNIFFMRFFSGDVQMFCILLFCMYCGCQVSTYIKNKEKSATSPRKI